ncbi:MAG: heparinase II/III family protein, partial [Candidatus Ornithospirochaeta sp.]|nr:heparinase II/III family protein [Candidatus Ornithospirochaeta sp.]
KYLKKMRSLLPEGYSDYVLSGGKEGRKPARESYMLSDAMLGIMRNGWDRDSVYLDFDMGPWGSNHMNEDQLSVELYAYGKHLLSNCGRWRYTTSPGITWLDKAQYFKTTAAYSSVLCDGLVQNQKGAHGMMESNDAFDYARGLFDGGYGTIEYKEGDTAENGLTSTRKSVIDDAWHKREVVFLKEPALFIVKDTLHSPGMHSLDQIWHFPSDSKLIEGEDLVYEDEGVFLRMKQLMPYSSRSIFLGSEKPFRGWTCPEYNCLEKAYEAEFSFRGENTVKAVTILYPGKGIPELDASIDCADGEDTISIVAGGKLYRVHLFDDIAHCIVD